MLVGKACSSVWGCCEGKGLSCVPWVVAGVGGCVPLGELGEVYPSICFVKVTNPVVPSVGLGSLLFALHVKLLSRVRLFATP